jgi:hypothetical protein
MKVMSAGLSELLWPEQSVDEINQQPCSHEGGKRVVEDHDRSSSETLAGVTVANRQRKKDQADSQYNDIQHWNAPDEASQK